MPTLWTSGEVPTLRVRLVVEGPIGRVILSRPEKRNALSPETIRQLRAALEAASRDDGVRVILLVAAGPDFCAGADLEELEKLLGASDGVHRADARALVDLFLLMRSLPKPIIGAVQGRALAGGAGLVTACDVVLAADDAAFGYPEVRIGFVPAIVTVLLRASVGEKAAFDLVATGRQISAQEAARLGIVTRVVPAAELDSAARALAEDIAALPTDAVARTKALFRDLLPASLEAAFEAAVEANISARGTAAFREGLSSFLARQRSKRK